MRFYEEPAVHRSLSDGDARSIHAGLELSSVNLPYRSVHYGFSIGDPVREWRRGIRRKSLEKLQTFKHIYLSPSCHGGGGSSSQGGNPFRLTEEQIGVAVLALCDYVQTQRERYAGIAERLRDHHGATMKRF